MAITPLTEETTCEVDEIESSLDTLLGALTIAHIYAINITLLGSNRVHIILTYD